MSEQLQLALDYPNPLGKPAATPVTQLTELPGTEWEHIFGLPAPGDGPDGPFGPFEHPREDTSCTLSRPGGRMKEPRESLLEETFREYVEAADWYRRCLEDVQDHRVVRGLGEAKAAYDSALDRARAALGDE